MSKEIWKPVLGSDDYEVSSLGRLLSLRSGRILKGSRRKDGYISVTMGRGITKLLHNIVLEAHIGPRPTGMLGCHDNDDGFDNRLENLAWGTPKQNANSRVRNHRAKGKDAANAKLSQDNVLEICRRLDAGEPIKQIAADFSICEQQVGHINTGYVWAWLTNRTAANGRNPGYLKGKC